MPLDSYGERGKALQWQVSFSPFQVTRAVPQGIQLQQGAIALGFVVVFSLVHLTDQCTYL